ncbi:Fic family protein [Sphingomonas glacialis]|uniref:Fido domain-containing protein n=1 Tax=Sphingomonas glacialis TaxID=658225 RepID=A0A502FRU5_9SPHN|nr:Fic family protein [Sphingomonas glacialis]TPG52238.1 hypothetical protein EAH76_16240 [Sphingomonas glacialis]
MSDVAQGDERHWICPPRTEPSADWLQAITRWSAAIGPLSLAYSRQPSSFGLELRTAYYALLRETDLSPSDNDFWANKCRTLFARPAVEPIVTSFWKRPGNLALDRESALHLATLLAGQSVGYRKVRAVGRSWRGDVHFEPLAIATGWQAVISEEIRHERRGQPIYVFARTIMAHPFTDGNGRFARVLFASILAREFGLPLPCIAFAPSFYRYGERLHDAMAWLSIRGDWQRLTQVMIEIVDDAVNLTKMASSVT